MNQKHCLIYCNCGAGIISEEKKKSITEALYDLEVDTFEIRDICSYSLQETKAFNSLDTYDKKFIVACYPRAIDNIFKQNGVKLANYTVLNFRELSAESIRKDLLGNIQQNSQKSKSEVLKSSLDVPAWYPVIDNSSCTLCGQCARFCVFGVYKYNKKSLEVINPLACKNNCPACGRTCPVSAIIFPRLPENSFLSGAEPEEDRKPASDSKKDGLFVLLNERNNVRRNIFRQGFVKQAEEEKNKAIEEFKKAQQKK